MRIIFSFILASVLCGNAFAAEYHIGPGQTYTTIAAAPWSSMVAGDTMFIHAKPDQAPYFEHIYISAALKGTEALPIRVIGVDDGEGNQPIIDGENSTTGVNFDAYGDPQYHSRLGLLVFDESATGGYGSFPEWVTVSNLTIRNYCSDRSVAGTCSVSTTDENGVTASIKGQGVYLKTGKHITLDKLTITNNANGIFGVDNADLPVEDITVSRCNIYGNGVSAESGNATHNIYTEVKRITFEGNKFGPLVTGSPGNNVKDRSAGMVFRYNRLSGGARLMDIVECQANCTDHTTDPAWNDVFVYGNIFYAGPGEAGQLFHLGTGDGGADQSYWRKNLYFYNNTVHMKRNQSQSYSSNIFVMSGLLQTAYVHNNIFFKEPETVGQASPEWYLQYDQSLSNGFPYTPSAGARGSMVIGSNWASPDKFYITKPGVTVSGTVEGFSNIISTGSPLFADTASFNYELASGSVGVGIAGALPALVSSGNWTGTDLTPVKQYVLDQSSTSRANISDLGALIFSGVLPTLPVTTPSRAPGRYTATQQLSLTASAGVAKYCFGAGCTPTATYSAPIKVLQNLARQTVRVQSVDGSNVETVQDLEYFKRRRR